MYLLISALLSAETIQATSWFASATYFEPFVTMR